ncbi:MAG TPA: hypothetical protein VD886_02230 [Herpetosiphonaceae bacterium]|nr:hypothetical protein [Herpetosiphonaceae bacterium]
MTSITCRDMTAYLLDAGTPGRPPAALAGHAAACPECRLRLLAVFQSLGLPVDHGGGCAACREDLDAFVEEEQSDPGRAQRWYPHVWSHLWVCRDCLEAYDALVAMAGDDRLRAMALLPRRAAPGRPIELIRLLRAAIQAALPRQPELVRSLYAPPEGYELWEGDPEVWAWPAASGDWSLVVRLAAPARGRITAAIDDYAVSAELDPAGSARLDIPARYLTDPGRGDLTIGLEARE